MSERVVLKKLMLCAGRLRVKLLRNNRGMFLTMNTMLPVRAGLEADGSSDLIGWYPVTVTPEMVGKRIAVFCAIEGKSETGRVSVKQNNFLRQVTQDGGISGVARDDSELVNIFNGWGLQNGIKPL